MACYHPMDVPYKIGDFDGKKHLNWKILKSFTKREDFEKFKERCENGETGYKIIQIPCGKCIGCRLAYSRQWANRCLLEAQQYENNQFVTLTYASENLSYSKEKQVDKETGEIFTIPTLVPEDLTKFMKDLRRYYKYHYNHEGIRFYACGEYGEQYHRPHFHLIIFNLPIEDLQYLYTTNAKNKVYTSEIISKIWDKGLCSIGEVTWDSAAYVARYVMKKLKGRESETYKKLGIVPEFVRMSRNEGIAKAYYEQHKEEIYKNDEIILQKKDKVEVVKPCSYYDKMFDIDNHELMEKIKAKRAEIAQANQKLQLEKTNLTKEEYLEVKERNKMAQIQTLKRAFE